MIRLGGASDPEEERREANAAIFGSTVSYLIVCAAIHISPYFLEQLGFEVTK